MRREQADDEATHVVRPGLRNEDVIRTSASERRNGRSLAGQRALVTGASGGIGRAVVELFVAHGANVVACDLTTEEPRDGPDLSPHVHRVIGDVANGDSVGETVAFADERLGGLDVLVNCAGTLQFGTAADLASDDWNNCLAVNLTSVYLTAKAVWPRLAAQRHGVIVTIGSVLGAAPLRGDVAYCASKAGVIMLTRCLALDGAAWGIRANCVSPGYVDTPMTRSAFGRERDPDAARESAIARHPVGRLGRPEDVSHAVRYLASEEASWLTGVNLFVDGGYMVD